MLDPIVRRSTVALGFASGLANIFGDSVEDATARFFSGAFRTPGALKQGVVVAYHPQTHSAMIQTADGQSWACVFSDEYLSYSFGFSESNPPREGELVLAYEVAPGCEFGIVVGRVAVPLNFSSKSGGDKYNDKHKYHRQLFTADSGSEDYSIQTFSKPLSDSNDFSTHVATHFRPTDVYPGEFAKVNQHNCGIKGSLFSTTLLGGGASLRMSALTNGARLTCDSYKRISMLGNMHEFHNGRYLSSERDVAIYQEERLGGNYQRAQVWSDDQDKKAPESGANQTIRPRIKDLSGYFGNLSSRFCLRPDPSESGFRTQGDGEPKEAGVSRETIDPSGQYRLSAAGMLVLERTGRIPVPVRKCYPTDKDHDIESSPETLKAFKHNEEDPCYRQLELFDRQAYDLKTQYSRVDGLGTDEPDYTVPQEDDLEPLEDVYDQPFTGSETVKLNKFDKRRAGVYIGEDGSIILRDAWGSEIVMLAGNVTISCAGNVMMLPGKTQLTIAGDDIVQKAQNSVDIHASEHDVRLSAARNMEIVGGGDESSYSGGVIIESKGSGPTPWDGKDKGESAQVSGITLRTKKQAVVVDGQNVVVRSRKMTRILSGDKDMDGEIGVGAKMFRVRTKSNAIISSGAGGNIMVSDSSVIMSGKQAIVTGEDSAILDNGGKYPIPIKWEDIENIAAKVDPQLDESTLDLEEDKEASIGFDAEALEKMVFGFRTSEECSTTTSWAVGGSGGVWRMYEPAWIQVKSIFETLKNGGVNTQAYKEEAKWDNGKPFPGKEAEDSAEYVQLSGLKPKNLTSEGFNKSREEVEDKSEVEPTSFKSGYLVRK